MEFQGEDDDFFLEHLEELDAPCGEESGHLLRQPRENFPHKPSRGWDVEDFKPLATMNPNLPDTQRSHSSGSSFQTIEKQKETLTRNRKTLQTWFKPTNEPRFSEEEIERMIDEYNEEHYVHLDAKAARTWVYPCDMQERKYQEDIARVCLEKNTLVVLPTGLGKTFIAAVVMYNYFRWFPRGLIVFIAPTKPLVNQQIQAFHGKVHIPQIHLKVLNGRINREKRARLWADDTSRVFFCTPQTLRNDIDLGNVPLKRIVLVVMDEAHHSTGEHDYVKVVQKIAQDNFDFRVVGLSATPGNDLVTTNELIRNLRCVRVEIREEDDPDVKKYIQEKRIQLKVVKPAKEMQAVETMLDKILKPKFGQLSRIVRVNCKVANATCWNFLKLSREINGDRQLGRDARATALSLCQVLQKLASAREKLRKYGFRECRTYLMDHFVNSNKRAMAHTAQCRNSRSLVEIVQLLERIIAQGRVSHPKITALEEILLDHFASHEGTNTKVIVFIQMRESVANVVDYLTSLNNQDIRPTKFVGQASSGSTKGLNQRQQKEILKKFGSGEFNVLVATSIAEEGLDIGEVDLIVNFDTVHSKIRNVQRMGRTGRKRAGRCVALVTAGKEASDYMKNLKKAGVQLKRLRGHLKNGFSYPDHLNPRMLPPRYHPIQEKKKLGLEKGASQEFISVTQARRTSKEIRKASGSRGGRVYLTPTERMWLQDQWGLNELQKQQLHLKLDSYVGEQSIESSFHSIGHSRTTKMMSYILSQIQSGGYMDGFPKESEHAEQGISWFEDHSALDGLLEAYQPPAPQEKPEWKSPDFSTSKGDIHGERDPDFQNFGQGISSSAFKPRFPPPNPQNPSKEPSCPSIISSPFPSRPHSNPHNSNFNGRNSRSPRDTTSPHVEPSPPKILNPSLTRPDPFKRPSPPIRSQSTKIPSFSRKKEAASKKRKRRSQEISSSSGIRKYFSVPDSKVKASLSQSEKKTVRFAEGGSISRAHKVPRLVSSTSQQQPAVKPAKERLSKSPQAMPQPSPNPSSRPPLLPLSPTKLVFALIDTRNPMDMAWGLTTGYFRGTFKDEFVASQLHFQSGSRRFSIFDLKEDSPTPHCKRDIKAPLQRGIKDQTPERYLKAAKRKRTSLGSVNSNCASSPRRVKYSPSRRSPLPSSSSNLDPTLTGVPKTGKSPGGNKPCGTCKMMTSSRVYPHDFHPPHLGGRSRTNPTHPTVPPPSSPYHGKPPPTPTTTRKHQKFQRKQVVKSPSLTPTTRKIAISTKAIPTEIVDASKCSPSSFRRHSFKRNMATPKSEASSSSMLPAYTPRSAASESSCGPVRRRRLKRIADISPSTSRENKMIDLTVQDEEDHEPTRRRESKVYLEDKSRFFEGEAEADDDSGLLISDDDDYEGPNDEGDMDDSFIDDRHDSQLTQESPSQAGSSRSNCSDMHAKYLRSLQESPHVPRGARGFLAIAEKFSRNLARVPRPKPRTPL